MQVNTAESESSQDRLERLSKRKFRTLDSSMLELEKNAQHCVEVSRTNGYQLVAASGKNPKVILYGITHPGGQVEQGKSLAEIVNKTIDPKDVILNEGAYGEVAPSQGGILGGYIKDANLPHGVRMIYNDDRSKIVRGIHAYQSITQASGSSQKEILARSLLDIQEDRDSHFCYDHDFGLVTIASGKSADKKKFDPSGRSIQFLGVFHIQYGQIEQELRKNNIPFQIYVPDEFTSKTHMRELSDRPDMTHVAKDWVAILHELGYVGRNTGINETLDRRFGYDRWARAFIADGKILTRAGAIKIYEDGYYHFLKERQDIVSWLVNTASEVYDIAVSNIASGFDYDIQECDAVHLQDISVRRVLTRLALDEKGHQYDPKNLPKIPIFKGSHPIQIRGHESEGYVLNPGKVPFHRPDLILSTNKEQWWDEGSIEDFYQSNKVLLVDPSALEVRPVLSGAEGVYYRADKGNYYLQDLSNHRILWRRRGNEVRGEFQAERKRYREIKDSTIDSYRSFLR